MELGWYTEDVLIDLVCHEIAHIIHFELRRDIAQVTNQSIWQLYTEGFATRYSQKMYKEDFYHHNKKDWLVFCQNNITKIKAEYLRRLEASESTADFFGDWNSWMGHSDVGYYLGCEFIKWLEKEQKTIEIARMHPDEIHEKLFLFLQL